MQGTNNNSSDAGARFGKILRTVRMFRGMSMLALAREAKINSGYISRMERGLRNPPSVKIIRRLADALAFPSEVFMVAAGHLEFHKGRRLSDEGLAQLVHSQLDDNPVREADELEGVSDKLHELINILCETRIRITKARFRVLIVLCDALELMLLDLKEWV